MCQNICGCFASGLSRVMLNSTNVPPKHTEPCPVLLNFRRFSFSSLLSAGLKGSLQRMQLEYVDVVFANRPDSNTPMEGR